MPKRDPLKEIKELQRRLIKTKQGSNDNMHALLQCMEYSGLTEGPLDSNKIDKALAEYAIVKLVAILQSVVKEAIGTIVDDKDKNNQPLPKVDDTITLEQLRQFKRENITLGQFVSHLETLNSCTQIYSVFEHITGENFEEVVLKHAAGLMAKQIQIPNQLGKLFYIRNIICHELAYPENIERNDLLDFVLVVNAIICGMAIYTKKWNVLIAPHHGDVKSVRLRE